ncbi:MAG: hypothetical protein MI867_09340, partial [Pseudomonadales bacterium]|nr:hypothetical protein [Pseudomonadales bacterium]
MRSEVQSALETIHTFKTQYIQSWVLSEKESLDSVYFSPESLDDLFWFTENATAEERQYINNINKIRRTLLNKVRTDVQAEVSIVSTEGRVLVSSNLEMLRQMYPSWPHGKAEKLKISREDTRVFLSLKDQLHLILVRGLYRNGEIFGYAVLEKNLPIQYLYGVTQNQPAQYRVYLYQQDAKAVQLSYQQFGRTFQFRAADIHSESPQYWLQLSGWQPFSSQDMVGIWGWSPDLSLGVAVVADSQEAFKTLRIIQSINLGFLLCILVASAIIAWFFKEYRKHRLTLEHQLEQAIETQAKDLNDERREKQTLVEALFQNSSDGYLVINGETAIDCNPASCHMLNLDDTRALIGKNPFMYSPPFQPDGSIS